MRFILKKCISPYPMVKVPIRYKMIYFDTANTQLLYSFLLRDLNGYTFHNYIHSFLLKHLGDHVIYVDELTYLYRYELQAIRDFVLL